jgi:WD40 repeat protein
MAAPEVHHLFHHPIADHSFSADKQTLAVARDTSVELYGRTGSGFKLEDSLKGHDKTVTSVDIAPNSGRIVTCSQGRSHMVPFAQTLLTSRRSERISMGTISHRVQANSCPPPNQPRSNLCALVSL